MVQFLWIFISHPNSWASIETKYSKIKVFLFFIFLLFIALRTVRFFAFTMRLLLFYSSRDATILFLKYKRKISIYSERFSIKMNFAIFPSCVIKFLWTRKIILKILKSKWNRQQLTLFPDLNRRVNILWKCETKQTLERRSFEFYLALMRIFTQIWPRIQRFWNGKCFSFEVLHDW